MGRYYGKCRCCGLHVKNGHGRIGEMTICPPCCHRVHNCAQCRTMIAKIDRDASKREKESRGHRVPNAIRVPDHVAFSMMSRARMDEALRRVVKVLAIARIVTVNPNTPQRRDNLCIGCGAPDPLVKGSYCLRCVQEGERR